MSSDIELLRLRLELVEQEIADPSEFQYAGQDRGLSRSNYSPRQYRAYQREARILRKLLARARSGKVLQTLTAWRRQLGQFAVDHRHQYDVAIRNYDAWCQLPHHVRWQFAEPPRPPLPRYVDPDGAPWIVDDSFLALLDDLIERLQKWLSEDERS